MREIKTFLTKEELKDYNKEMNSLGLTIKPSIINQCPDMIKGDIGNAVEDKTFYVSELDRTMFKDQRILNLFFRIDEPRNSHDLERFHFPEEIFKEYYTALYNSMKWKIYSSKNQNYDTASSYTKMKVRAQFVKQCFIEAGILNENAEISFKGYTSNPDMYQFKYYSDNLEYVEYDKFRETGGGLYDLGTNELELLKPNLVPISRELATLRTLILGAIKYRLLMILDLTGAVFLIKELSNQDKVYKNQLESVNYYIKKIENYFLDNEFSNWLDKGNNDYTLYVKKNKKNNNAVEYVRRQTELAYIEAYHNALGALFGYEIFDKEMYQTLIKENRKYGVFGHNKEQDALDMLEYIKSLKESFIKLEGKLIANKIFAPSKSEDSTVSYKENLDWKAEELDDVISWAFEVIEYEEPEDCNTNSLAVDAEF